MSVCDITDVIIRSGDSQKVILSWHPLKEETENETEKITKLKGKLKLGIIKKQKLQRKRET